MFDSAVAKWMVVEDLFVSSCILCHVQAFVDVKMLAWCPMNDL